MPPQAGSLDELRAAAAARPDDVDALMFLGNALVEADRPEEAVDCYQSALALRPDHPLTHYNLGNAQLRLGQPACAEASYRAALRLVPQHAGTLNNLGNALRSQGRLAESAASYRAALALRSDLPGTHTNLGATLIALRRPDEALPHLDEAMRLDPTYAEAANNLGGALLALDRLDDALGWFERAAALDPELVQAEFGAAMVLLAQGRFAEGWARYEARWRDPHFTEGEPVRAAPLWDGSDLRGRTILLHAEQGLGDTIQFVRYAPILRAQGARVILEVQPGLLELCRPLADLVIASGGQAPPHEWRCPLMSLPHALGTTLATVPAAIPYLHAAPRGELRGPGCNIGLVFCGAVDHPEDDLRSVPANVWWPVLGLPATTFHLLQPDLRQQDAASLAFRAGLRRHDLADFAATAGLVAALDVVVTVDTAVAHLAGAMGRTVLLILQHSADFRWLRGREDSPWYPTVRLFRRGPGEEWPAVLQRVAAALARYAQPPSTTNV